MAEQWIRVKVVIDADYILTGVLAKLWVKAFERKLKGFSIVERVEFEDYKVKCPN